MVKNIKSHMKTHFLDPSDQISFIRLLARFRLACDTSRIHEKAEMWVLPFFVKNTLEMALYSRMYAATHIPPEIASINSVEPMP